jgi:uncharacterized membrane protein YkvI
LKTSVESEELRVCCAEFAINAKLRRLLLLGSNRLVKIVEEVKTAELPTLAIMIKIKRLLATVEVQ